jgi:hypothetical protein
LPWNTALVSVSVLLLKHKEVIRPPPAGVGKVLTWDLLQQGTEILLNETYFPDQASRSAGTPAITQLQQNALFAWGAKASVEFCAYGSYKKYMLQSSDVGDIGQ